MTPLAQHSAHPAFRFAFTCAALIASFLLHLATAGAGGNRVGALPPAVDAAIESLVPDYDLKQVEREREDGEFVYEVEGTGDGVRFEMEVAADGTILESEIEPDREEEEDDDDDEGEEDDEEDDDLRREEDDEDESRERTTIPLDWLPNPVATTLTEVASNMRITEAERKGHRNPYFKFEGTFEDVDIEIKIASNGTLLEFDYDGMGHRRRGNSVPVEILPDAVLDTLDEFYPDLEIEEVEITSIEGDVVYEIEGLIDTNEVELYITPGGQLVRHEVDSDGDGLPDTVESDIGCDPEVADTDGDAFPDGFETDQGSDPLDPSTVPQILSIDLVHGAPSEQDSVVLTVATFQGGIFEVEHCPLAKDWNQMGISITGDDASHEIVIPVDDASSCGFFRVALSELSNENDGQIGSGGTAETGFAPDDIVGTRIEVDFGDDSGKDLVFDSASRGHMAERTGRRIEVEPFSYRYVRTGRSTAKIIVRFPRWGEDRVVEYELEFSADGVGTVVRSDSDGTNAEGSFTQRQRPGRSNRV